MAEKIGVSKQAIEMQIANLKAKGMPIKEGANHMATGALLSNYK